MPFPFVTLNLIFQFTIDSKEQNTQALTFTL
jgi:hypothetical protein